MNEAQKNYNRRERWGDHIKYFNGHGIDIGCGDRPYLGAIPWDKKFGNSAYEINYPDRAFDWVHSSHCLEHLERPDVALAEWFRVLKLGGFMIVTVPHFTLYEKRQWPSLFNGDHKMSYSPFDLQRTVLISLDTKTFRLIRLQVNDEGFNFNDFTTDQTNESNAQSEIEIIIQKVDTSFWSDASILSGGIVDAK